MHEERYDDDSRRDRNSVNDGGGGRARARIAVKPLKGRHAHGLFQQFLGCHEISEFKV